MVPLPKYTRPITKPNGRILYGFQKFRGTGQEWPRVPLPADPLSAEFVHRIAQCELLDAVKGADGAFAWVFVDPAGHRHELPSPRDGDGFWAAVDKAEDLARRVAAGERKTFSALIMQFKESDAYKKDIGDSTREAYERYLRPIEETWGDDAVAALTPEEAQKAIDAFAGTPGAARYFRSTLSRVIGWGIPRGYRKDNPIEHTEKVKGGGSYSPWPPEAFEIFFEHARPDLHLPVYSLLFTGQRKGDMLDMLRPKADATEMPIVAQKTKIKVPVQIHSEYRGIIAASKADHVKLHLREDGQPWAYEGFKTAWQREMARPEFKLFVEKRYVPHGLRKNAVCMLLEVGCSEALVGAIVGMSEAMVRHYSKEISKFRLARSAMKALEAGWGEQRVHVLGNVKKIG